MILSTTSELPKHQVMGIVTAQVSCIREYLYQFNQEIMDELSKKLENQAQRLGADAVIGHHDPTPVSRPQRQRSTQHDGIWHRH